MASTQILKGFVVAAILFLAVPASALEPFPPPTVTSLAGVWVGPGAQGAYFRLELNKQGHGLLVIQSVFGNSITYYKVKGVVLNGYYKCSFKLVPVRSANPTVSLHGICKGDMHLVRSGTNPDNGYKWQYKATLQREKPLLRRLHAVKQASKRFRATH